MKRLLKQLLVGLAIVALVGVGSIAWYLWPRQQRFYTDAGSIKTPEDIAVVREILWTPPAPLSERLNTAADDYEPHLSSDGRSLFFVRGQAGQNADIYRCLLTADGWTEPEPLAALSTEYDELGPELSADGRSLYFYSDRIGGLGGYDLWVSRLGEDGWRPAANLGPNTNSPYNDYGPAVSPEGKTLYFSSNRPPPDDLAGPPPHAWPATLREERHQRDYDLYSARITDGGVGRASALTSLNSDSDDGSPAVSPYGDFLYFSSNRPGGFGGFDVYRSRRLQGGHRPATNLGATVNSAANELDPDLSLGGYALHFSSDRTAAAPPTESVEQHLADETEQLPDYNLYYATSREVFRETETQQASINWAALWAQIGPNLLLALLALLLTLLLLALLRDFRQRKLSLLARCLLASLLFHLLLMLLLNVVEVTTNLANVLRGRGKIQVALMASAAGDEIAVQIRGELTQVEAPVPETFTLEPPDITQDAEPIDPMSIFTVEHTSVVLNEQPQLPPAARDAPLPTEETTPPPDFEVEVVFAEALPTMDLTLPTESNPVDAVETDAPVRPEFATDTATKAPPRAVATTQPAWPVADQVIEPARVDLAALDRSPTRPADMPALRDAEPTSLQLPVPQTSLPAEVTPATLSDLSLPNDEASPPSDIGESSPTVQFAAAGSVRPAVDSALPATARPAPSAAQVQANPAPATHEWVEESAFSGQESPPMSTAPATVPVAMAAPQDLDFDAPALGEIALPPVAETTIAAEPDEEWPAGVQAVEPDQLRAESTLSPGVASEASAPANELAILPPARQSNISEQPGSQIALTRAPADASAADVPLRSTAPQAIAAVVSDPLPLELDLPAELASPGNNEVPGNAIGTIRGRVVDAESGEHLPGAAVRLVLPEEETIVVTTDEAGLYELAVPPVPDFFALSASLAGYVPGTANLSAGMLSGRPVAVNFELAPQTDYIVAIEEEPDVHHLGNDLFDGRINSRFQKVSEGRVFRATFEISEDQLPPNYRRAEVWLMAKGVQCPHQIRINGRRLRQRLDDSPGDGSFGEFTASFKPAWLEAGTNKIKILAKSCSGDLDDFEFVNLQIRLLP